MYDTVLIATDGSAKAENAVAHGLDLAETYGASVHALSVVDSESLVFHDEDGSATSNGLLQKLTQQARRATAEITRRAEERGLDAESAVIDGTPAREIRAYADEHDANLIAMGTSGRSGISRFLLGSVTESVLRKASQPVLTARAANAERSPGYDRILFPTDGGERAERVAEHAFDIASRYDATVHALSVIDTTLIRSPQLLGPLEAESKRALDAAKSRGKAWDVNVVTSVWRGTPGGCIKSYAAEIDADLVTMGSHQNRRLDRFLTQTVAERVVRTVSCPVITIR